MDLYIGTRLAGSPFLKTIQSLFRTETGPGRPFLSFGALKEMVRSPAFQAHIRAYDQVEVIARWLIYFLPDTYFIPSGLFCIGAIFLLLIKLKRVRASLRPRTPETDSEWLQDGRSIAIETFQDSGSVT